MPTELPKTYEPAAVETEAYKVWLEENAFGANPAAPGDPYCIVIPPPNVTGALHLGHAINTTLQDILIRKARMEGKNTLWVPGIDHAGIATQAVVEKQLKEKENKTRHDVGREALVERIWTWKQQYGDRILEQLKRMGCSCDWSRTRFTLDEMCARAVRETFFKLFKDGLIYRGKRLVNWDIHLQTSISDDEIYHETVKTFMWHIKYPIVDAEENSGTKVPHATHMTVATTRPETMLGDTAVAVHSEDPRWNWAIGKFVELPLTGRKIPIIADDILVDPKFGSGVVKVTPAHDPNDYAVYQRHLGKSDEIGIINILTPEGRINENGGAYAGMKRDPARKKVVEDLTALGLLVKEEPYETQVGHSDRSKTPVEPYLSDQWFVHMAPLAEPALEVVRDGTIKFFPARHAQQYLSWLGEKRDWPISRQLWWGHRIPVWHVELDDNALGGTASSLEDRRIQHLTIIESRLRNYLLASGCDPETVNIRTVEGDLKFYLSTGDQRTTEALTLFVKFHDRVKLVDYKPGEKIEIAPQVAFPNVSVNEAALELDRMMFQFRQDEDVLDTWFSSALWPHSTLGWPEENPWLEKYYPTSVLLTGRDIITLWVARMVMMGMYNMGPSRTTGVSPVTGVPGVEKSAIAEIESNQHGRDARGTGKALGIPFYHVAINPTILDGKGERMSKSKGNGVDPVEIIDTHGADALRFTLATMATETQDVRMPVKKDSQGRNTSDKFDLGRNFCNKLWNASRFIFSNLGLNTENTESTEKREKKFSLADRWIISRFNRTVDEANKALEEYRFDVYSKACYSFFWDDFCDWYIEATKPAMKDPARAGTTANVLAAVLDGTLRLMHPIIPFITETIWWRLSEIRPERGIPGYIMGCTSKRLVHAAWPKMGQVDEAAESIFPKLQAIIGAIRNLRNDYKVDQKKIVSVSINAPAESARSILENRELIESLASCSLKEVQSDLTPPAESARATAAGCDIYVEGLVDANAEKERIAKRREELTRQIAAMQGRLNNPGYIGKAPPHLVDQTKAQLAEAEAELAKLTAE